MSNPQVPKINGSVTVPTWVLLAALVGGPSIGGAAGWKLNDGISQQEARLMATELLKAHRTESTHPDAVDRSEYREDLSGIDEDLEDIKQSLAVIKDRMKLQ